MVLFTAKRAWIKIQSRRLELLLAEEESGELWAQKVMGEIHKGL